MLIATGAAATLLPAVNGLPLFGYGAIALIVIGGILAMPQLAPCGAARRPARPRACRRALRIAYLRASPGRVAATLAAMVASVSLMVAMAIMVTSFRQSLDDWLTVMLPADLYVRGASRQRAFHARRPQLRWRGSAASRAREFMRATSVILDAVAAARRAARPRHRPARCAARLALVGDASCAACRCAAARVDQRADRRCEGARARALASTLPLAGRDVTFTVAGVWRDYVRQQGAIVIERSRYVALTGDDAVNEAALWLARRRERRRRSRRDRRATPAAPARVLTATPGDLRKLSLRSVRSHVCRHLCARGGRRPDRPRRTVGGARRADARATAASSACCATSA